MILAATAYSLFTTVTVAQSALHLPRANYLDHCNRSALAIGQAVFGHEGEDGYLIKNIARVFIGSSFAGYLYSTQNGDLFVNPLILKSAIVPLVRNVAAPVAVSYSSGEPLKDIRVDPCFSSAWDGKYPSKH